MTGAELFVECLVAGGIDTVYALPGEETTDLMDALAASKIDIVLCRHEQGAAFMASVHGRLTGRPAACLATLGPGASNLVTGLADATLDHAPVLAITGQGGRPRIGKGHDSHQILDLKALMAPVTKSSREIRTRQEIPGAVAEALHVALTPRPGAVHLSLPEDVAAAETDGQPVPATPQDAPHPSPDAIRRLADRIARAERPVVLAGAGVLRGRAAEDLATLLQGTGLPMASSFMAKGILPAHQPQNLGAFGLPIEDHVDHAIHSADLLVCIGLDPVEYPLGKLTDEARIDAISLSDTSLPRDAGWHLGAEAVGDLAAGLRALGEQLTTRSWPLWPEVEQARDALRDDLACAEDRLAASPPPPEALVAAHQSALAETDLIFSGVGTHKLALARNLMPRWPGQIVIGNGLAGMGLALPGAIAAARLRPDLRITAICGDGDVMMNLQEMETASRLNLSLTVVVWVDGGYGLIEDKQEEGTGTRPDLSFSGMDWASLARAFGWGHTACETADDLAATLTKPCNDRPARQLITVPVKYSGNFA